MRIAYVTHPERPSGIDLWRALDPGLAMRRLSLAHVSLVPMGGDPKGIEDADVLVLPSWGANNRGSSVRANCEQRGILLVVDVCDDPTDHPNSPLDGRWKPDAAGQRFGDRVLDLIGAAHLVTVNTPAMADRVATVVDTPVEVVPDRIEPERWKGITPGEDHPVTIGVCGGDRHGQDWSLLREPWSRIAAVHPEVVFRVVGDEQGGLGAALPPGRYTRWDFLPIDRYQLGYAGIDIACAPLADTTFNQSKSPNKWLEHTLAGSAVVASPACFGRVIFHSRTGLIANTADQWVHSLDLLIRSPEVRRTLNREARRRVLADFTLDADALRRTLRLYETHRRRVYARAA